MLANNKSTDNMFEFRRLKTNNKKLFYILDDFKDFFPMHEVHAG